jgi:metal-responsive CopG/Arc/MetJ family transcriptional regulator
MQITVRLPNEYGNRLDRVSKQMGVRRSDIIRLAMKQFLEGTGDTDRQPPYERVRHLLGLVESDVKDLGQSHRKYLIQKVRRGSR